MAKFNRKEQRERIAIAMAGVVNDVLGTEFTVAPDTELGLGIAEYVFGDYWARTHETRYGPVRISGDTDNITTNVMMRFDDVKAAREGLGNSNPYSGKWNHHYVLIEYATVEDVVREIGGDLRRRLERIKLQPVAP